MLQPRCIASMRLIVILNSSSVSSVKCLEEVRLVVALVYGCVRKMMTPL